MTTSRLEDMEEIVNDHCNAAAVGIAPPPDLADAILREIRAAIPPDKLAEIIRKLPTTERRHVAELLTEPPVKHTLRIRSR